MLRRGWQRLCAFGRAHPFAFGVSIGTVKTGGSDFCAQAYIERRPQIDWPRVTCFTLLGFVWVGCIQQVVYVKGFSWAFPHCARFTELPTIAARLQDRLGLRDLVLQTSFVNFIWIPLFFHFFYPFQEFVHGVSAAALACAGAGGGGRGASSLELVAQGWRRSCANFGAAIERCHRNLWSDCKVCWGIWIPGHLLTFSTPLWLRMPLTHALSFLYFGIFSVMRGEMKD